MANDPALRSILKAAWQLLLQGCADSQHGFHWPVLATVDAAGGPDARTVVLRTCDAHECRLQLHSDARAGKVAQLNRQPLACLVFHDAPARTQLRVYGNACVHVDNALAQDAWSRLSERSRSLYAGPARFAAIDMKVERMDWLLLDEPAHRRAGFDWLDTHWQSRWLTP